MRQPGDKHVHNRCIPGILCIPNSSCSALVAEAAHTNSRGMVHGGLISALADNAMGLSCAHRLGPDASLVTVNLALDFLGAAKIGQWLEFDTVFVKPGSTLAFAQAFVTADGEPCARANGTFRVVRKAAA